MTRPQPAITALFESLQETRYTSYVDLERAVRERFNSARAQFPAAFGYRDAISWAADNGLVAVEGGELIVRVGARAA